VKKLARDFAHKRYRAVCSDLTAKQRRKLGGTKTCMVAPHPRDHLGSHQRQQHARPQGHVQVGTAEIPPRPRVRRVTAE